MMIKQIILIAIFSLGAFESFGKTFSEFEKIPITIEKDGVVIKGYRIRGSGLKNADLNKPAKVFYHGLMSNYHEFEHMITRSVETGSDTFFFNWRGHGNGDERSLVTDYKKGDYDFDQMVQVDFPRTIEAVWELHPGPVDVVGHSMGGMVPRAALAEGRVDAAAIRSLTLIGSPAHFKAQQFKNALLDPLNLMGRYLDFGSGENPVTLKDSLGSLKNLADFWFQFAPGYSEFKKMWEEYFGNRLKAELGPEFKTEMETNWMNRSANDVPKDILKSFLRWVRRGYPYEKSEISIPIFHVTGEKDNLAPANDIAKSAIVQSSRAGYRILKVKGIGHFGLVMPWVVDSYTEALNKFWDDPQNFGAARGTEIMITPRHGRSFSPRCEAYF